MSARTDEAAGRSRRLRDRLRTAAAASIVTAAGLCTTYAVTDGLQAFSLESARRLSALRSPAPVPGAVLEFADARHAALVEQPGQILLVDFIYTQCATYCQALGSMYARMQDALAAEVAAGKLKLVSVSFDPAHDGIEQLQRYRGRYGGQALGWDLARPLSSADLEQLLRAFGVVVIPDGLGGFTHNAAVHVVDRHGRLAAILDLDDIDGVVRFARELLDRS